MKKIKFFGLSLVIICLNSLVNTTPARATSVASSNADATSSCTQNFTDTTYVTIYRYSNDCVLIIKNANNTTSYATSWTVPANVSQIRTLLVGGGGGGAADIGGGGGGGQVRLDTLTVTPSGSIGVLVGKGGIPGLNTTSPASGGKVGDSSTVTISGVATIAYGGCGGVDRYGASGQTCTTGFTGGGGSYSQTTATTGTGGASYAGGNAWAGNGAGGGGGAGGAGGAANTTSGTGGAGVTSDLSGTSTCYGGGGSGGGYGSTTSIGTVSCGGGLGKYGAGSASAGTQNLGGGGGGEGSDCCNSGGNGGSGIVIIRYTLGSSIASTTTLSASNTKKLAITTITATLTPTSGGTITFYANGRRITRCINISVSSGSASCNWKPLTQGATVLTAVFTPTDSIYIASTSTPVNYLVGKRTTAR